MSDFGKLLRNSRFASLAKPLSRGKNKKLPTHQLIETRAAALGRQEWGLKYALPSKIKSRYITFNDVDSLERIVDFETNGGDLWKRLRFQETGVVPRYEERNIDTKPTNPLFEKEGNGKLPSSQLRDLSLESLLKIDPNASTKELQSILERLESVRPYFKAWLLQNEPVLFKNKSSGSRELLKSAAVRFLKELEKHKPSNRLDNLQKDQNSYKINAFGGLSYGLKGRIANSPNGYVQQKVVPARYLTEESTTSVAVGGFVGSVIKNVAASQFRAASIGKTARETVAPMTVTSAVISDDGSVNINLNPVSIPSGRGRGAGQTQHRVNARRAWTSEVVNVIGSN